jgi:glycosyltransferase involved in cell wall biosynthesis
VTCRARGAVSASRRCSPPATCSAPRRSARLVLLHDPELLLAVRLAGVGRLPPVVWDVHEDTAVALGDREWVPGPLRRLLAYAVRRLERWAERNVHLVLAEDGYRDRFRRIHPVVRNHPWASQRPDPSTLAFRDSPPRVVYVGRISRGRGVETVIELGRALGRTRARRGRRARR